MPAHAGSDAPAEELRTGVVAGLKRPVVGRSGHAVAGFSCSEAFSRESRLLGGVVGRRASEALTLNAGGLQMASLQFLAGNAPGRDYLLEKDQTVLGRSPSCDVVIPSYRSARRHARILRVGDRFDVEDLDTVGGTRVNGPELCNQIKGRTLPRDGDSIWFGIEVVVRFRE